MSAKGINHTLDIHARAVFRGSVGETDDSGNGLLGYSVLFGVGFQLLGFVGRVSDCSIGIDKRFCE